MLGAWIGCYRSRAVTGVQNHRHHRNIVMKEEWRKEVAAGITTPEKREVYRHQEAVTIGIKKE